MKGDMSATLKKQYAVRYQAAAPSLYRFAYLCLCSESCAKEAVERAFQEGLDSLLEVFDPQRFLVNMLAYAYQACVALELRANASRIPQPTELMCTLLAMPLEERAAVLLRLQQKLNKKQIGLVLGTDEFMAECHLVAAAGRQRSSGEAARPA